MIFFFKLSKSIKSFLLKNIYKINKSVFVFSLKQKIRTLEYDGTCDFYQKCNI